MKYEYMSLFVGDTEHLIGLNNYYKEGWEPVSFVPKGVGSNWYQIIFVTLRRELK